VFDAHDEETKKVCVSIVGVCQLSRGELTMYHEAKG